MKKTTVLWIILSLLFLIIFNAIFFLVGGTDHNASVWISYTFIHFAYFMLLITPALTRKGKSAFIFGITLYSISTAYFLLSFVTGIIFILIAAENINTTLLVQLCIAGLYGIFLISNMIANERTVDTEEKRHHEIAFVKDASAKLKGILENVKDKETKKNIEKVYDAIYSSPAKSHEDLAGTENSIIDSISKLEYEVKAGNKEQIQITADEVLTAINERNRSLLQRNK